MQSWKPIALVGDDKADRVAIRLNALGSLFFHISYILGRDKLAHCHVALCRSLEREQLHFLLEWPRFHFKTTIVAEGLPSWWSLPFNATDEYMMRKLGYGDEWIRWMHQAHDQDTSTLIIAETEKNAVLMGTVIDQHYQMNEKLKWVFPEIIPDGKSTWNNEVKIHKRINGSKEGTYHYRGVGQAIQGLHPKRCVEDDIFGMEAQQSEAVRDATIRYHRMLGGVLGSADNIVDGNRWALEDLNGWIREHDKTFEVQSHSAEGGCCDIHPIGQPIFPEEWSMENLAYQRQRMGDFDYHHQFLNVAMAEGDIVFKPEWLRYYNFKKSDPKKPADAATNFLFLEHEVLEGKAIEDIPAGSLDLRLIVDPNHGGQKGRCAHAISVTGYDQESNRFYLLDEWSKSVGYRDLCDEIYKIAEKWGMKEVWLETVAAQIYLKLYLEELAATRSYKLYFRELPLDNRAAAKDRRIESLEPYIRNENFWIHRTHSIAKKQLLSYYRGKRTDVDLIDTVGYAPQLYNVIRKKEVLKQMRERVQDFQERVSSVTGY